MDFLDGLTATRVGLRVKIHHDREGLLWTVTPTIVPGNSHDILAAVKLLEAQHRAACKDLEYPYPDRLRWIEWLTELDAADKSNEVEIREFIEIDQIEDRPLLPKPIIPRLAWPGLTTVIHGLGKVGKSELFSQALSDRNTGQAFLSGTFDKVDKPIGIACEMSIYQAARYVRQHGIKEGPAGLFFLQNPTEEEIGKFISEHEPCLFVVDTLTQLAATTNKDLNDAIAMRQFINRIRQENEDVAILLVHHTGWSGHIRNSTDILNAVDIAIEIDRVHRKSKDDIEHTDDTAVTTRRMRTIGRGVFETSILDFDRKNKRYFVLDDSDSVETAKETNLVNDVLNYIMDHPGCSKRNCYQNIKGRQADIRNAISDLVSEGALVDSGKGLHAG